MYKREDALGFTDSHSLPTFRIFAPTTRNIKPLMRSGTLRTGYEVVRHRFR